MCVIIRFTLAFVKVTIYSFIIKKQPSGFVFSLPLAEFSLNIIKLLFTNMSFLLRCFAL